MSVIRLLINGHYKTPHRRLRNLKKSQFSYQSDAQFLGWQKTYPVSKGKESCFKGDWKESFSTVGTALFHRWNTVANLFPIPLHMVLQPCQPYFATYGKPVETSLQLSYQSDVQLLGWQKTYPVSMGKESSFKGDIWLALPHPPPSPPLREQYASLYSDSNKENVTNTFTSSSILFSYNHKKVFNLFTISEKKVLKANTGYYCEHEVNYN